MRQIFGLVLQKELERLGYRVQVAPDGEARCADSKKAMWMFCFATLICPESMAWKFCDEFMTAKPSGSDHANRAGNGGDRGSKP